MSTDSIRMGDGINPTRSISHLLRAEHAEVRHRREEARPPTSLLVSVLVVGGARAAFRRETIRLDHNCDVAVAV